MKQLLLVHGNGLVVVQPLRLQHLGQVPLVPRRLLQLRPFVLEPDLKLVLGKAKLNAEVPPPLLGEISVPRELGSKPLQLLR